MQDFFSMQITGMQDSCKPESTLHGYLSKILARSCQDLGKILAKIVTRYCQELQDAMVRSFQESHVSKKNLTKKPNMARKILLRSPIWHEKSDLFHYVPPYITRYTMSPLENINVCGSFIFISYWLISHAILSIN